MDGRMEQILLNYRAEISGMEAENKQREIEGKSMAFTYDDFIRIQQYYIGLIKEV